MQSGAEEEWDDEDWDDMDDMDDSESSLSFISDMPLFTNMRIAIGVSLVILLLLCSMVFTNFGLYYGAGGLSVLIDVNEGKDTSDRTFNFNILATSPTFGMLAKEGDYSIHFNGAKQSSGKFNVNDEGRGSISVDYESFFATNGNYTLKVELGSESTSNMVTLNRFADSLAGEVISFDGVTEDGEAELPIDHEAFASINLQFTSSSADIYINPWVTGSAKVYHYEKPFNQDQGKDYWDDDSKHGGSAESGDLVETINFDIDSNGGTYTYSSGKKYDFFKITDSQASLLFLLDIQEFYDAEGSGDYTIVFDFTNDFGEDASSKEGRTYWAWFHICEIKSNGECEVENGDK